MNMITISTGQIIIGTGLLIILPSLVQWLLAMWIKARLEKSIQHEYDKKLEDYKFSQLQRQKAEIIARLFAKWIKYAGNEETFLDSKGLIDYYEELNQMSLELSLWVPDKEVLSEIMARLQNKENSKDISSLIVQIRKIILDNKNDAFDHRGIVLWPKQETRAKIFGVKKP